MISTKYLMAGLASAVLLSPIAASAQDHGKNRGPSPRQMFERADANNDGKLTLEEMLLQSSTRFDKSDANGDGEISVEEMTAAIQRERDERRARRRMKRLDFNGDGKVTKDEITTRAKKRFSMMDRDDNGVVEKSELRGQRRGMRHKRRHHRRHSGEEL